MFKPCFVPLDIQTFIENKLGKPVEFFGKSGHTSDQLIGEQGIIHDFLKKENREIVFLSLGQNDLSKIDLSEFHPDIAAQALGESISNKVGMLGVNYPGIKFILLPLSLRNMSQFLNPHWPQNHDPLFVNRCNEIIRKIFMHFSVHTGNVWFVNPSFLHQAHEAAMLTEADGLHLNEVGKKIVVHETIRQILF